MAELTRLGTESMTVRHVAIGLLQFRIVNVKPTADQVCDGGMSCIVRNAFLKISMWNPFVHTPEVRPGELSAVHMDEKKSLNGYFVSQNCLLC